MGLKLRSYKTFHRLARSVFLMEALFISNGWNSIYNILVIRSNSQMQTSSKNSKPQKSRQTPRKAKYDIISYEKRKELINLVIEDQVSIYRASRITGINNATAKVIIRKYREEGAIFIRKSQKEQIREEKPESSQVQDSKQSEKPVQQYVPAYSQQYEYDMMMGGNYMCHPAQFYLCPTYYMYQTPYF